MKGFLARLCDIVLIMAGAAAADRLTLGTVMPNRLAHVVAVAIALALAANVFPACGIYRSWRARSVPQLLIRLLIAWGIVQAGTLLILGLDGLETVPMTWLLYWTGLTGAGFMAVRMLIYATLGRFRQAGLDVRPVAVVGCGAHYHRIVSDIEANAASGFRIAARLDWRPDELAAAPQSSAPAFHELDALAAHVREAAIGELWLVLPLSEERLIHRCMELFRGTLVNIRFLPDVEGLSINRGGVLNLFGAPAISLSPSSMSRDAMTEKETFDRLFSAFVLFVISPVLLAIAIAIKLSSPGPVLFKQKRKGLDGRVFTIYKFRTMRAHVQTHGVVQQATRNDPRVTTVGGFLRRTSLDELPQFFNVLRGEMSVVGPRPHALEHDELYRPLIEGYLDRYRAKPGITGWAQVNGFRGETDKIEKMVARVEHDLYYLQHWSFAFDIRIVAATVLKGFIHSTAY
ncbi:undecaprenyl-phosphate glucose phosphotransferase [Caballeronia sp. LjRoot29]|uniref:undecaprenyl-phosphate glucose phosphotransferase n=1 Tax=Caballeronia sp. LjRoot29 TaxID=3342315 RepID=UPI003ECE223D